MPDTQSTPEWWIFQGTKEPHDKIKTLPAPPSWRKKENRKKGTYIPEPKEIEVVNAALYLRRPILVTGKPGTGKSSLADAVAYELGLGNVFRWSITTQTILNDGLYQYDAIGRLQGNKGNNSDEIQNHINLGALGSAFATSIDKPSVLLIDEIDKSDIDLPNNLLHIFEESEFEIPELVRHSEEAHEIRLHNSNEHITIKSGKVVCKQFPLVIMTSNGEREFPPAFLRRCLQLNIEYPNHQKLANIVNSHFEYSPLGEIDKDQLNELITNFLKKREGEKKELATDQLLNAVQLILQKIDVNSSDNTDLLDTLWHALGSDF